MTKIIEVSQNTQNKIELDIDDAVYKAYKAYGIEKELLHAFIKQESNGYPYIARYEPGLKGQSWYEKTLSGITNPTWEYYSSWGLMQILFGIAKTNGFTGSVGNLMNIETNVMEGAKHLSILMKKHGLLDAISTYNQGAPRKDASGQYLNRKYVDHVYSNYKLNGGKQ